MPDDNPSDQPVAERPRPARKAPRPASPPTAEAGVQPAIRPAVARRRPTEVAPTLVGSKKKAPDPLRDPGIEFVEGALSRQGRAPRAVNPPDPAPRRAPRRPVVVPTPFESQTEPQPQQTPARSLGATSRAVVALTVLLIAAAAGLGAAAAVESRPMTWEAVATVQLVAGDNPSPNRAGALAAGVARYEAKVANSSFTALSVFKAGLPAGQVREPVTAGPGAGGELRLTARAATVASARALAAAGAQGLVETVDSDQQLAAPSRGDRLHATTTGAAGSVVRVQPRDRDAALAGGLAAGAVLLVAAVVVLLRRGRSSAK